MHDEKLQYMLDYYIKPDLFSKEKNKYCLEEPLVEEKKAKTVKVKKKVEVGETAKKKAANENVGATKFIVSIVEENLCIQNCDKKPINSFFCKDAKKCVDHVIWQHKGNAWILHLIEMKSTIGYKTWINVRVKNRDTYLAMSALAAALDIHFTKVKAYTTYGEAIFKTEENPDPLMMKPALGEFAQNVIKEWETGDVKLLIAKGKEKNYYQSVEHTGIQLSRDEKGILRGSYNIE